MQADVAGLRQQLVQGAQRVAAARGHQVVVVHQDVEIRTLPPAPITQLGGRHVRAGQSVGQRAADRPEPLGERLVRRGVVEQVVTLHRPQQATPVVGDHQPGLRRRVPLGDSPRDQAQQVGLAALRVAEDRQVRLVGQVQVDRRECRLVDADRETGCRAVDDPGQLRHRQPARQQPHLRRRATRPVRRHVPGQGQRGLAQIVDVATAVDPRDGGEEVQLVPGQATTGRLLRHVVRRPTVDLGLRRVAEAQLQLGAKQIPHVDPDLRPPYGGEHHVHTEAEAPVGQRGDGLLQLLVLLAQGVPPVHHQEHVAERVVGELAGGTTTAVARHRVDAVLGETSLPLVQDGDHLSHRSADRLDVAPTGHPGQVRQPLHAAQRAPAEVQAEELHLPRRVRERQRGQQRTQHRALATHRPTDDDHVAAGPGQLDHHRVPTLLVGAVHHADRHCQSPTPGPGGGAQPVGRVDRQRAEQLTQARRVGQRRQPHLVGRAAPTLELVDQHVEHRHGLAVGRLLRLRGGGHRHLRDLHRNEVETVRHDPALHQRLRGGRLLPRRPVRPRHVRGPEPQHGAGVRLQVAVARRVRQLVRVRYAEHDPALHRGERPQTDPVRQVGVEAPQLALFEALAGQQQVHAEGPTQPADHHEQVDEVRFGGEQFAELVTDDQQAGHRRQRLTGRARLLVLEAGDVVAGRPQQLLPAHHLSGERVAHPVDQRQLVGQVGDHRAGVRQRLQRGEGRAALEVDQDEVQFLRRVGHRQRGHHRTQQFALAGAGRTDHQTVRAHALVRRLLEVELDHVAVRADPERDAQPVAVPTRAPGVLHVHRRGVTDAEQVRQLRAAGQRLVAAGLLLGKPEGGDLSGQPLGGLGAEPVGPTQRRRRTAPDQVE
ncbi:hypothetical protein PSN01_02811 [Micromonospora saelicesensis]|nr:hypothetical protein PSN01_02811 [Micromonospora saelicesensis]